MRRTAKARNRPTPTATVRISAMLGMEDTCWASTCKSGSEMVMITPIKKAMKLTSHALLVLEICTPMPSPKGVMAISAPSWKRPMPKISIRAPTKNMTMGPSSTGTKITLMSSTMAVMGSTAASDSIVFSRNFGFKANCVLSIGCDVGFIIR